MKIKYLAALVAACAMTHAADAQDAGDASSTWFSQEGAMELTFDHFDGKTDTTDTLAVKVEYAPSIRIADRVTVQGQITAEGLRDINDDSAFEGMGAYVETLNVQYAGDAFTVYAGKINPAFGLAADLAPGLYGDDMAKSYETVEMIGAGGDVNLAAFAPGMGGEHVLSAAVFTADRSMLSGSVGEQRDRVQLADGGPGNTRDMDSFVVALDGAFENGIGYSLGARTLAAGLPGEADERGLVAGISYAALLGEFEAEWAAEIASFDNAGGVEAGKRTAFTLTGALRKGDWFGGLIVSGSDGNTVLGGGDVRLVEVSVGRDFAFGLTLDAAVQAIEEDGENATLAGLRLTWGF